MTKLDDPNPVVIKIVIEQNGEVLAEGEKKVHSKILGMRECAFQLSHDIMMEGERTVGRLIKKLAENETAGN